MPNGNCWEDLERCETELVTARIGSRVYKREAVEHRGNLKRAEARIEAALELHWKMTRLGDGVAACGTCSHDAGPDSVWVLWPCPTVKALRGEENSDG
jgi:hypothetical protein